MMTTEKTLELMRNERLCIQRAVAGCDRNCGVCELVKDDAELLAAYDAVIAMLEIMLTIEEEHTKASGWISKDDEITTLEQRYSKAIDTFVRMLKGGE